MKKIIVFFLAIMLVLFAVFSYAFIDQNLSYLSPLYTSFAFQHRLETVVIYSVLLTALTGLYLAVIRLYFKSDIKRKTFISLIGISVVVLLFAYPAMLSYDIFNYIATAKVAFFYRENPYIIMPVELTGDPLLLFTHAANKTALYGPVWILITAVPSLLGLNNFISTLLLFKLTVVLFYILTLYLVYYLTKNRLSVLLFGLNPLVMIETLVSGHNDVVMMSLVLSAFLFVKKKNITLSILFLLLSIGIKFATVFLIPVFIYVVLLTVQKKKIYWDKIYYWSSVSMFIIFLLSPFREEMYPWYALWFFVFVCMTPAYKRFLKTSILLSLGLMLRYLPYMYFGEYHSSTILLRSIVTFVPLAVYIMIISITRIHNKFLKISIRNHV